MRDDLGSEGGWVETEVLVEYRGWSGTFESLGEDVDVLGGRFRFHRSCERLKL